MGRQKQLLRLLDRLCTADTLDDFDNCYTQFPQLFASAADTICSVKSSGLTGHLTDATRQLMHKLFFTTRVGLRLLLQSCLESYLKHRRQTSCVHGLLHLCGHSLQPYIPGNGALAPEVARDYITQSDFLPTYAAACSAVAESITYHLQLSSSNSAPSPPHPQQSSSSRSSQPSSPTAAAPVRKPRATRARAAAIAAIQAADLGTDLAKLWLHMRAVCVTATKLQDDTVPAGYVTYPALGSGYMCTLAPISKLAIALLRFASSSTDCSHSEAERIIENTASIAQHLCLGVQLEILRLEQDGLWDASKPNGVTPAADDDETAQAIQSFLTHNSCQELYMLVFAAYVALQDHQQQQQAAGVDASSDPGSNSSSRSKSSKQQQQQQYAAVSSTNGYKPLLQLLGVSEQVAQQFATEMLATPDNKTMPAQKWLLPAALNLERTISLSHRLITFQQASSSSINDDCVSSATGSSSSTADTAATLHVQCEVHAVLNTLLQVAVLCPGSKPSVSVAYECGRCMEAVIRMLHTHTTSLSTHQPPPPAAAAAAAIGSEFVTSLVLVGGSSVLRAVQQSSKARRNSDAQLSVVLSHVLRYLLSYRWLMTHQGQGRSLPAGSDPEQKPHCQSEALMGHQPRPPAINLSDIMQQQPLTVIAALEAAARAAAADDLAIVPMIHIIKAALAAAADSPQLLAAVAAAAGGAEDVVDRTCTVSKSDRDAGCRLDSKSSAAKIISFLISCLKLTTALLKTKHSNMVALECAVQIALTAQTFAAAAAAAGREQPQTCCSAATAAAAASTSSSASSATLPWVHVVARALHCCSTVLLWPHTGGTSADEEAWNLQQQPGWHDVTSQHPSRDIQSQSPVDSELHKSRQTLSGPAQHHTQQQSGTMMSVTNSPAAGDADVADLSSDGPEVDQLCKQQVAIGAEAAAVDKQQLVSSSSGAALEAAEHDDEHLVQSHRLGDRSSNDLETLMRDMIACMVWCNAQVQQLRIHQRCQDTAASAMGINPTVGFTPSVAALKPEDGQQLQQDCEQLQQGYSNAVTWWLHGQLQQVGQPINSAVPSFILYRGARAAVGYHLSMQLRRYASSICAVLPNRLFCNNSDCRNVGLVKLPPPQLQQQQQWLSELGCVGSRKCSRCGVAGYCSRECQLQHWRQHKLVCRRYSSLTSGQDSSTLGRTVEGPPSQKQ